MACLSFDHIDVTRDINVIWDISVTLGINVTQQRDMGIAYPCDTRVIDGNCLGSTKVLLKYY